MVKGIGEVFDRGEIFDVIKKAVNETLKGKRTIFNVIIVTIDSVYSLKSTTGRKRAF